MMQIQRRDHPSQVSISTIACCIELKFVNSSSEIITEFEKYNEHTCHLLLEGCPCVVGGATDQLINTLRQEVQTIIYAC